MASLTEELIDVLEKEDAVYKQLIPITEEKTKVIIKNDLDALQAITDKEQDAVERLSALEKKRGEIMINMGTVLNRDPKTLKLRTMVELLAKRPAEQKRLAVLHDSLTAQIKHLAALNDKNKMLIDQSLEMIQFEMNLIQNTRMVPGTGNYTRGASTVDMPIAGTGMFDAKQ